MVSLKNLEDLKLSFCNQYLNWSKNATVNDNDTTGDKKNPEDYGNLSPDQKKSIIERNNKKIAALELLNQITEAMDKKNISDKEINLITNIVVKHPELTSKIIDSKIKFPKELLEDIFSLDSFGDVIKVMNKFISERNFQLNYDQDPTHKNSTGFCGSRDNPSQPLPPTPDPDKDKVIYSYSKYISSYF